MEIEIRIDPSCPAPKLILVTSEMTGELEQLLHRVSGEMPQVLTGLRDGMLTVLEPSSLLRVYACGGKVFAVTETGEYLLRLRLYEAETRLDHMRFVRISNSEIINLRKVRQFDLSLAGTISVILTDGTVSYVSRRYVTKVKRILGL